MTFISNNSINYLQFSIPDVAKISEITKDVFWIRMPLQFKLDHINLWLLRDKINNQPGWTLIDTGLFNQNNKIIWKLIIEKYFFGLKLQRVICTHMHPDHIGLANWFCKGLDDNRWNAELWMSHSEFFNGKTYSLEGKLSSHHKNNSRGLFTLNFFYSHGCNIKTNKIKIDERSNYYSSMVPDFPISFHKISDKQQIKIGKSKWKIITGAGHSPEHVSLYNNKENLLISGDMVLPSITSHIGVFPDEPNGNPLEEFLTSLNKFKLLPKNTFVLPSHGQQFEGIMARIKQLENHHQKRMQEILSNCKNKKTAYELIPKIFSTKLDNHQFFFALCEIIAHLNYGWHMKKLRRFEQQGIIKFETVI